MELLEPQRGSDFVVRKQTPHRRTARVCLPISLLPSPPRLTCAAAVGTAGTETGLPHLPSSRPPVRPAPPARSLRTPGAAGLAGHASRKLQCPTKGREAGRRERPGRPAPPRRIKGSGGQPQQRGGPGGPVAPFLRGAPLFCGLPSPCPCPRERQLLA